MEVLITGGTGLLGRRLVKSLSNNIDISQIFVLVRDIEIARDLFEYSNKIELLEGDIKKPNLGLSFEDLSAIGNVSKVYHLAACINLGNTGKVKDILFTTNVMGTSNVLNLLNSLANVSDFYFVSTAYVGGKSNEEIPENWINKPKEFRNFYEESKWECENLIKNKLSNSEVNYYIIRPSILLDNLEDMDKVSCQTIYLFSNILKDNLPKNISKIRIKGNSYSSLNFVFVDDLVKFITFIGDYNQSKIFNFVSDDDILIKDLLKIMTKSFDLNTEILFNEIIEVDDLEETEKQFNLLISPFLPYFKIGNLRWSNKNNLDILNLKKINLVNEVDILENVELYCKKIKKNE